uniref:Calcium/calmodulin-dependent 3',5'-cyclic nucleotide phosphodiesterase 1C n=1 Tax=Angiostrongylus cantonensis TaxID=6313 RepID=A0A0K0D9L5_ANGCA
MSTRLLNPDDADDSDSSDSTDSPARTRHRSATVSPSTRNLLRDHPRRRSDFNLYGEKEKNRRSMARNSREPSVGRRRLRKTNSEPNVEGMGVVCSMVRDAPQEANGCWFDSLPVLLEDTSLKLVLNQTISSEMDTSKTLILNYRVDHSSPVSVVVSCNHQEIDIIALSKLLNSIPKITTMPQDDSDFCGEDMLTEIEELRDAAKTIQSLQRVLKRPQHSSDRGVFSDADESSVAADSSLDGRVSGISTRLGHPRGVMQFLPSMGNDLFMPSTDTYRGRVSLSRKTSAPDAYMPLSVLSNSEQPLSPMAPRTRTMETLPKRKGSEHVRGENAGRRRGVVDELFGASLDEKRSESLAGMSRFSKLLRSFRSGQSSPEPQPTISWRPYDFSESAGEECRMEDSLLQADILLWKKRSRASLRKHYR